MIRKRCLKCKKVKEINAFVHRKDEKNRRKTCKTCVYERERNSIAYAKKIKNASKLRRFLKKADPIRRWANDAYGNLSKRSKENNIKMTLTRDWLRANARTHCPMLGVRLDYAARRNVAIRASVDRINPNKGYTPENCQVVSFRANSIKNDATIKELEMIVRNLKKLGAKHGCR